MAVTLANVNTTTDTWLSLIDSHNQMRYIFSTTALTSAANSIGATTSGNVFCNGVFASNVLVAVESIRGGTVSTPTTLTVSSNLTSNGTTTTLNTNNVIGGTSTVLSSTTANVSGNVFNVASNTSNFSKNVNFTSIVNASANVGFNGAVVDFNNATRLSITTPNTTITSDQIGLIGNTNISGSNTNITANLFRVTSNTVINTTNTHITSTNTTITGTTLNLTQTTVAVAANITLTGTTLDVVAVTANVTGNVFNINSNNVNISKNLNSSGLLTVSGNANFTGANVVFNTSTQVAVNSALIALSGTSLTASQNLIFSGATANITGTTLNVTSNTVINTTNTHITSTNTTITGGSLTVSSVLNANLIPSANTVQLGNTTNRFVVRAADIDATGDIVTTQGVYSVRNVLSNTADVFAGSNTNLGSNTTHNRVLFSLSKTTYRSGKIDVQIKDLSNNYQISTVTFIHNDTDVFFTSSETLNSNTQLVTLSADYSTNTTHIDILALQTVANTSVKWYGQVFR